AQLHSAMVNKRNYLVTTPRPKPTSTSKKAPTVESTFQTPIKPSTPLTKYLHPPYAIHYIIGLNGKSILQSVSSSDDFDFHDSTERDGRAVEKAADSKGASPINTQARW
ncbi:MAG: hypothetical protein Q9187_008743, partial [Circinaria calcarea]